VISGSSLICGLGVLGVAPSGFSGCSVLPYNVNSLELRNLLLLPLMDDLLLCIAELKKSRVFFANLFFFLLFSYFGKGPGAFCNANFPCKRSRLAVLILNLCINASPLTARGSEKKGCTSGCSLLLTPRSLLIFNLCKTHLPTSLQILYRDYCVIRDTVQASMKATKNI